jgi:hypothetical protein
MIVFSAALRRLLISVAAAFIALVSLGVHGFSLPAWHLLLDGSPATEVLLGRARMIRWDDWGVQLPLALAQVAHEPAFPLVNQNIGLGQNMLAPIAAPVAHPLALFRPTSWGFFLGSDVGLAWMWWAQVLGLFVALLLLFMVLTRNRLALSCAGSLLLLFSPFMQFWSFNAAPLVIYMSACTLATGWLLGARRRASILASGLALGWAAACFALAVYPPYQVVLGYLFLFLLAGFLSEPRRDRELRVHLRTRFLGLALASLIAAGAVLAIYLEAADVFASMRNTVYPGARVATGGDAPLWRILNSNLWTSLRLEVADFSPLVNLCEAASFWLLFPVVGAAVVARWLFRRTGGDPVEIALLLYCTAFAIYGQFGIPESLARVSFLGYVPARRALLGLGIADAFLLLRFLSRGGDTRPGNRLSALSLAALFALLLALCARSLHEALPQTSPVWLVALVALNGLLAYLVLRRRRPATLVSAMAAGLFACTAWFNPLVVGGADYLTENPLSREILAIDRQRGGESVWLAYGDPAIPNIFRMIGVRALNGTHPVPQVALWEKVDPLGEHQSIYNRYANIGVERPDSKGVDFEMVRVDGFTALLDPEGEGMSRLGVTHLLVQMSGPHRFWHYEPLAQVGPIFLFELPLRPRVSRLPREHSSAEIHTAIAAAANDMGRAGDVVWHYREALRRRPDWIAGANNLAWILATSPDAKLRDAAEAIRVAEGAVQAAGGAGPLLLDTLAAGYAAAGRFDAAVRIAGEAAVLAAEGGQADLAEEIRARLELFRQRRPYLEAPGSLQSGRRQPPP